MNIVKHASAYLFSIGLAGLVATGAWAATGDSNSGARNDSAIQNNAPSNANSGTVPGTDTERNQPNDRNAMTPNEQQENTVTTEPGRDENLGQKRAFDRDRSMEPRESQSERSRSTTMTHRGRHNVSTDSGNPPVHDETMRPMQIVPGDFDLRNESRGFRAQRAGRNANQQRQSGTTQGTTGAARNSNMKGSERTGSEQTGTSGTREGAAGSNQGTQSPSPSGTTGGASSGDLGGTGATGTAPGNAPSPAPGTGGTGGSTGGSTGHMGGSSTGPGGSSGSSADGASSGGAQNR